MAIKVKRAARSVAKRQRCRLKLERALLPSGSTLLDLACSGSVHGAFAAGTMVNIVGDSSSGKSLLALSALAEASRMKIFKDYKLIYDDAEAACAFPITEMFGERLDKRMQLRCSDTIEDFYISVDTDIEEGAPFIYVLDSMDSLTSIAEVDKFQERKKAILAGRDVKGSYGDKAKKNSESLRQIVRKLKNTRSILIIISQTRDNIGLSFAPKTHSGGRALTFYASHKIWTAVEGKLKRKVRGKDRQVGNSIRLKVSKNKLTGFMGEVSAFIYYRYGIDDVEANIRFLVSEGHWKKKGQTISATGLGMSGTMKSLVHAIEESCAEDDLKQIAGGVWNAIEEEIRPERKSKY